MQCHWSVTVGKHREEGGGGGGGGGERRGKERLAGVRQRLLLGAYDSDAVVFELARRLLDSGELEWDAAARGPGRTAQQCTQVDYRGL